MELSRQECWRGVPFPSPGDLPDPGMEPRTPALQEDSLPSELQQMLAEHQRWQHHRILDRGPGGTSAVSCGLLGSLQHAPHDVNLGVQRARTVPAGA